MKNIKKAKAFILAGAIFSGVFTMVGCEENINYTTFPLNDKNTVKAELLKSFGNKDNLYLIDNDIIRMPCPINKETIKININFQTTKTQKHILQYCIDEFNDIFTFINPVYKFELNYTPTESDLISPHNIDIYTKTVEELTYNEHYSLGQNYHYSLDKSKNIEGKEIYDTVIYLDEELVLEKDEIHLGPWVWDDENHLQGIRTATLFYTLKHEICHSLGLGDLYLIETENYLDSIMNSKHPFGTSLHQLSANDIKMLYSLYRDPEQEFSLEGMEAYIEKHDGKYNDYSYLESLSAQQN